MCSKTRNGDDGKPWGFPRLSRPKPTDAGFAAQKKCRRCYPFFFFAKSMQSGPKQQTTIVEGWSRSNLRCILAWSRAWSHMSGKSASIRLKPDLRHFWGKPWKTLNKKMFYQSPILDSMYQICRGSGQRFHTKCGELNPVVPAYALIIKREMLRGYYLLTPNTQTLQRFIPPFVQNNRVSQDSSESKLYQAEVV